MSVLKDYSSSKVANALEPFFGCNLDRLSRKNAELLLKAVNESLTEKSSLDSEMRKLPSEEFAGLELQEAIWQIRQVDPKNVETIGLADFLQNELERGIWLKAKVIEAAAKKDCECSSLGGGQALLQSSDGESKKTIRGEYDYLLALLERTGAMPGLDEQDFAIGETLYAIASARRMTCNLSSGNQYASDLPVSQSEWLEWAHRVAVFASALEEFADLLKRRKANVEAEYDRCHSSYSPRKNNQYIYAQVSLLLQSKSPKQSLDCLFRVGSCLALVESKLELGKIEIRKRIYGVLSGLGFVDLSEIEKVEELLVNDYCRFGGVNADI